MAANTFDDYGKVQAIDLLFEDSGFRREDGNGFEPAAGSLVRTASRVFVEGIDFDLTYFPLKHLGYKSVVAVAGENYAGMAHPRLLSVRLGVSAKLDFSHIKDLWTGVVTAAKEHGFKSLDLDLVPSPNGLVISVTAAGEGLKLTRGRTVKPRSMDLVCVSGSLGAAFLGQQILERGKRDFDRNDAAQPDLEKYKMLIVHNQDTPGHVAAVTTCLSQHGVNIATMQLYRSTAGGYAVMVLECDEPIPDEIAGQLGSQPGIVKVTILNL